MTSSLEYEDRKISSSIRLVNEKEHTFATILVFDNTNVPQQDAGDVLVRKFYTILLPSGNDKEFMSLMLQADVVKTTDLIVENQLKVLKNEGYTIQ